MQYSESPRPKQGGKGSRPNLRINEVRRCKKLQAVLPDARRFIDDIAHEHCRGPMIEAATPLIAKAVAEIAVLDGETDASDERVLITYSRLIAQTLGLEDDPCRAIKLWLDAATVPLEQFGIAWAQHLERANRNSESRHVHQKLVDLNDLSAALNATRPRMREIFGVPDCELPATKIREPEFSADENEMIDDIAKRTGWTTRRIKDHALDANFDAEAFTKDMWPIESKDLKIKRIPLKRLARTVRYKSSKPGPKPRLDTLKRQIRAVARWRDVCPNTVRTMYDKRRASAGIDANQETEAVSPEGGTPYRAIGNDVITDPILIQIVDDGRNTGRRKRGVYPERVLVEAWYVATEGRALNPATVRQWSKRGKYASKLEASRRWLLETQAVEANEAQSAPVIVPPVVVDSVHAPRADTLPGAANIDNPENENASLHALDAWVWPTEEPDIDYEHHAAPV